MNNDEPKITVFYEKFYIDSVSKHIPNVLEKNDIENICIKRYWTKSIDKFKSYDCITYLTSLNGDMRIVFPYYSGNGYKYTQYFISELDGKFVKIPINTLFGIENIGCGYAILLEATSKRIFNITRENEKIFDWH